MVEASCRAGISALLQKMRASPVHQVDARRNWIQQCDGSRGWHICRGGDAGIADAAALPSKYVGILLIGLVYQLKFPCIKRNSAGAVNAAISARWQWRNQGAIPADEVVDYMRRIGNALRHFTRDE